MAHWQQYGLTERIQLLDISSAVKALPRLVVEKDWWVVITLKALSMTRYSSLKSFHCSLEKFYHKVSCSTEPTFGTLSGTFA